MGSADARHGCTSVLASIEECAYMQFYLFAELFAKKPLYHTEREMPHFVSKAARLTPLTGGF